MFEVIMFWDDELTETREHESLGVYDTKEEAMEAGRQSGERFYVFGGTEKWNGEEE